MRGTGLGSYKYPTLHFESSLDIGWRIRSVAVSEANRQPLSAFDRRGREGSTLMCLTAALPPSPIERGLLTPRRKAGDECRG